MEENQETCEYEERFGALSFDQSIDMETEVSHESKDVSYEDEDVHIEKYGTDMNYKHTYLWMHVIVHATLQIGWLIGIYTALFHAKAITIAWGAFVGFLAIQGIGLGAHRGSTHKSFKATPPLRVALIIFQTMAGQNSMLTWTRDHLLHHKYSDTDADPHNSNRGFFFSHMGWLMMKKHPLVLKKQREIDVSDLRADKLVMFQYRYFLHLYFLVGVLFPVAVPMYFWNETFWCSFFVPYFLQYVTNLHITWSINSFAHLWGSKPYDKRIKPAESWVASFLTLGDGWHNFHHAFPWDYRMAEKFSISAKTLELLAYLGLAYDLKMASPAVVQGHITRHGKKTDEQMLVKEVIKSKRERKDANDAARAM